MTRVRPPAPSRALPATVADLEAQRIVKRKTTLADDVEKVFQALYEDHNFKALREALDAEDSVNGNIWIDDVVASQLIVKKASEMGIQSIEDAKLDKVVIALRRAESWVNASRKQRKNAAA